MKAFNLETRNTLDVRLAKERMLHNLQICTVSQMSQRVSSEYVRQFSLYILNTGGHYYPLSGMWDMTGNVTEQ